jgi:hypothetical protein
MVRIDVTAETHYRCGKQECPIHWNPIDVLFYLKTRGDWPLQEDGENANMRLANDIRDGKN